MGEPGHEGAHAPGAAGERVAEVGPVDLEQLAGRENRALTVPGGGLNDGFAASAGTSTEL